ncbi:MAG TPA: hypothetical protein VKS79_17730 [Gemmataceae bacterium]|nr:hypothetical protein [Gemmataceae bacterium]
MSVRPTARSLLICEQVIVEEETRNVSLINCSTVLIADSFPAVNQKFTVFCALIDGQGKTRLDVEIRRADNMEVIFDRTFFMTIPNRHQEVRFIYRSRSCSFPAAGSYDAVLFADGEPIALTTFAVRKR